jgi:hypothetical protein
MLTVEPSTVETVRSAVETRPNVWLAVGVAVGPLLTAVIIGWGVVKFLLPYVKEELAASRKHMSDALAARGNEAVDDIKAARELARVQHEAIVERIEGKIEHLDERAKTSETLLRSIAAKIGAVVLVLLLSFGVGFSGGAAVARLQRPVVVPTTNKNECDEVACSEEEYCCAPQKCCMRSRRAVDETEIARKPLSSSGLDRYATSAHVPCDSPRRDLCLGGR